MYVLLIYCYDLALGLLKRQHKIVQVLPIVICLAHQLPRITDHEKELEI